MTEQAFDVPKSIIFRVVHRIVQKIGRCKSVVIFLSSQNTLEEVGGSWRKLELGA